jgi:hypothetical protein
MIIGLSGYAQSGKDTVAGLLIGLHGYDNRSFAAPMRDALYKLNPMVTKTDRLRDFVNIWGWEEAKKRTDVRRLLQVFGTEIGREMFGENFWVDQVFKNISPSQKIVFTDVRFPNEAEAIKLMDGEIWRINRPGYAPVNDHPSESSMDNWEFDSIITNNSSLDSLKTQVNANVVMTTARYEMATLFNVF